MDYHKTLGVKPGATKDEIKKAYRKMANKYHPDKGGDPAEFHKIQEAYDALTNPQPAQDEFFYHRDPRPDFDSFQDFFSTFGRSRRQAGGNFQDIRNPDKIVRVMITAEQAYNGADILVDAQGVREVIKITPGIQDGAKLRIKEKGHHTFSGSPPGDLIIRVHVQYPDHVVRRNDTLIQEATVDALDAIVGGETTVRHVSGKTLKVKIPAGSQTGSQLRLSGWGFPNPTTGRKGDFYVVLNIRVPVITDPEHLKMLEQIQREVKKS